MRATTLLFLLTACGGGAGDATDDTGAADDTTGGDADDQRVGNVVAASAEEGCDYLDPTLCALPWPSAHFLTADASMPTGWRVDFADGAFPVNRDDVVTEPDLWNEKDGFSINSALLVYLDDVSLEGTAPVDDIGKSLEDGSLTVIVDVETGDRVPHWVEIDATADDDGERLLILRPAEPYDFDRHYVVGLRGLVTNAGQPVAPRAVFQALRDGTAAGVEALAARRAHFEDVVFPTLADAGFDRGELQLAWDFRTTSRENTVGRLEFMRDDALAYIDDNGFTYELTKVEDRDCDAEGEHIARDVEGWFEIPSYTLSPEPEIPDNTEVEALLTRDEDGMPFRNGIIRADFLARVPCSVARGADGLGAQADSAPILQYGHGLLGSKGEARTGWLARFADERGAVVFAMDWTGFMEDDVSGVTFMLAAAKQERINPSHFAIVSERAHQGMVEFVLGMELMLTQMPEHDAFAFDDGSGDAAVNVLDPSRPYYYGNSQGAIMGSAYVPLSPHIDRAVFGVGGGPYSLLLPRSKDFDSFFALLRNKYSDHRETMLFVIGLTQQLWDATEPGGWMHDFSPGAPSADKRLLMQVAIYDNQVTTLGAHYQARAYGAILPAPAVRTPWGLTEVDVGDGYDGNALVEWEYSDLPEEPLVTLPPGSDEVTPPEYLSRNTDPHECPRRELDAQEQAWHFLETGEIIQTCPEGGCVGRVQDTCP